MNKNEAHQKIKTVELFAGVGGFRLGLEGWNGSSPLSGYRELIKSDFEVVWSNQWEPSTKVQHASKIYEENFGKEGHSNADIKTISTAEIPDHDLLVGGFPCQDYSIANHASQFTGIKGKKGSLWWEIHRILREKSEADAPVKYILLENVDRILATPIDRKGHDFATILASLSDLGYAVEWRVVNAADYGMPQKRRRLFMIGYHRTSPIFAKIKSGFKCNKWLIEDGVLANAFPATTRG
ncbi:DNA cytosine methyltransferase [Mucilaginibacter pedocola]|uniref:DNA cytosine methyltransferase n=1 Tax=Mucilaginibacter pedocola TaxID=1792845 RepID=UPI00192E739D|nr:DNA (cytosine-5-)-methyltransferase [Mucilaginibacter pedocola]